MTTTRSVMMTMTMKTKVSPTTVYRSAELPDPFPMLLSWLPQPSPCRRSTWSKSPRLLLSRRPTQLPGPKLSPSRRLVAHLRLRRARQLENQWHSPLFRRRAPHGHRRHPRPPPHHLHLARHHQHLPRLARSMSLRSLPLPRVLFQLHLWFWPLHGLHPIAPRPNDSISSCKPVSTSVSIFLNLGLCVNAESNLGLNL